MKKIVCGLVFSCVDSRCNFSRVDRGAKVDIELFGYASKSACDIRITHKNWTISIEATGRSLPDALRKAWAMLPAMAQTRFAPLNLKVNQ